MIYRPKHIFLLASLLLAACHPKDDDDCRGGDCACADLSDNDHDDVYKHRTSSSATLCQAARGGAGQGGIAGKGGSLAGAGAAAGTTNHHGDKNHKDGDKGDGSDQGGCKGEGEACSDGKDGDDEGSQGKAGHGGATGVGAGGKGGAASTGGSGPGNTSGGSSGGSNGGTGHAGTAGTSSAGAAGACSMGAFDCTDPRISYHLDSLLTSPLGVANFAQKWACKHPSQPLPGCFVSPPDHTSDESCYDTINAQTQALLQLTGGACEDQIQRQFDQAAAFCAGPDVGLAQARFWGEVNGDYRRFALAAYSKTISIAQYLAGSRDRTRKRFLSENDPCWVLDYQRGDQDGDLVPDSRDQCPDTPDLTPTDDHGCPLTTLPEAPDADSVFKVLSTFNFVVNGNCSMAPRPLPPAVLDFSDDEANYEDVPIFTLSPTGFQPPGCPVFYYIRVDTVAQGVSDSFMLAFRQEEGILSSPGGLDQIVFRAHVGDPGDRGRFAQLILGPPNTPEVRIQASIQARTVNGRGDSSGWGLVRYTSFY